MIQYSVSKIGVLNQTWAHFSDRLIHKYMTLYYFQKVKRDET